MQLETEEKIIPLISKLFWEISFFPIYTANIQLVHAAALNAQVLYRLMCMEIYFVDSWATKGHPLFQQKPPRKQQNMYLGVMKEGHGE